MKLQAAPTELDVYQQSKILPTGRPDEAALETRLTTDNKERRPAVKQGLMGLLPGLVGLSHNYILISMRSRNKFGETK